MLMMAMTTFVRKPLVRNLSQASGPFGGAGVGGHDQV